MNQRARGITADGKPIHSEEVEHLIVAHWLNLKKLDWIHCPNGGNRNFREAKKLKRMGVRPGVPDFIIFTPPTKKLGISHVALELKALDGRRPTKEQLEFIEMLSKLHWQAAVIYGADAAIEWLERLY